MLHKPGNIGIVFQNKYGLAQPVCLSPAAVWIRVLLAARNRLQITAFGQINCKRCVNSEVMARGAECLRRFRRMGRRLALIVACLRWDYASMHDGNQCFIYSGRTVLSFSAIRLACGCSYGGKPPSGGCYAGAFSLERKQREGTGLCAHIRRGTRGLPGTPKGAFAVDQEGADSDSSAEGRAW